MGTLFAICQAGGLTGPIAVGIVAHVAWSSKRGARLTAAGSRNAIARISLLQSTWPKSRLRVHMVSN